MEQQGIVREILRIVAPVVRSLELVIWGIELIPSGRTVLRIYVDAPSDAPAGCAKMQYLNESARGVGGRGPSINQCANVSRHIGLALEAEGIFSQAYVLEVSSPGMERPFFTLTQLAPYVGENLELTLESAQQELPGRKRLRGKLQAVGERCFTLLAYDAPEGTQLSIPWDNVRKAALAPDLPFARVDKPGKKNSAFKADATSQ